jgi:hypothetical protein
MDNSLSPKQHGIYRELLRLDKKAAEAYAGALRVLKDPENPDRFAQSAHSLREITLIISKKVSLPQEEKKIKSKSMREKIEKQFVEKSDLLPSPADEITRGLIREWVDVLYRFFTKIAHHGVDVSEEEFSSRLSEFEALLLQFVKPVPLTLKELDSLLIIQSPTQGDTKRLSELLRHPTHVEYFFLRLDSPNWLAPLRESGFFAKPPTGVREGNFVMFPPWPLSRYLIKVAGDKPREVMEIIRSTQETDNFRVHMDFIECALHMTSSVAKEIIPPARNWVTTPHPTLLPTKLGELAVKLSNENEAESSLDLLASLLEVTGSEGEVGVFPKEAQPSFDMYLYGEILDNVVPVVLSKEPRKATQILCSTLSKAIDLNKPNKGSLDDFSYMWRPAIENHSQNRDYEDAENHLVTAIRESLERLGKTREESFKCCYQSLSEFRYPVFRRMELHLMRIFPDLLGSEIQRVLSQKEAFDDMPLWHEYYHLLQEQYSRLPQNLKENILRWIEEGPDMETYESWYRERRKPVPAQEEKDAYKANWQMIHLSAIREVVPRKWKDRWGELATKYQEPDHPDFHYHMSPVQVGPTSPLTKEDIKNKTGLEIVHFLKTWKPAQDFFGPSIEGLARILSEAVSEDPSKYIEMLPEFKTLHLIYICSLIEGLKEAARKGNPFAWNLPVSFCQDALAASKSTKPDLEGKRYDWDSVKRSTADLLEEGLRSKTVPLPFELREATWKVLKSLLEDDEPDLVYEQKYWGENTNPLTLSLNTVRGRAVHVLVHYGLWCARCLNLSEKENRMTPEVKEQLERMLDPQFEPTETIRSVYGVYFPQLLYLNKKWTEDNTAKIFSKDPEHRRLWRAAWEAYVVYAHFYDEVYGSLRDQYEDAVNKLHSHEISSLAKQKLSEHLMVAYLRKIEGLEDPSLIALFFKGASPEMREHALWFVGKEVQHFPEWKTDENSKQETIRRIMDLWEFRINEAGKADAEAKKEFAQELKIFGFWFVHSPFNKLWAIFQLKKTLEISGGLIEFASEVIETLQDYIDEYYSDVLRALILLAKGDSRVWLMSEPIEKIKGFLEAIIRKHPTQEIKEPVNDLVDALTRRGYHDFAAFYVR